MVKHRRRGFGPWISLIPWRRIWQLTPVFLTGKFHGQRSTIWCSQEITLKSRLEAPVNQLSHDFAAQTSRALLFLTVFQILSSGLLWILCSCPAFPIISFLYKIARLVICCQQLKKQNALYQCVSRNLVFDTHHHKQCPLPLPAILTSCSSQPAVRKLKGWPVKVKVTQSCLTF